MTMNQAHADQTKVAVQERCETHRVRLTNTHKQVLNVLLVANQALSDSELTKICNERFEGEITRTSIYFILKFLNELHIAYRFDTINRNINKNINRNIIRNIVCQHTNQLSEGRSLIFVICVQCNGLNELFVFCVIMKDMCSLANTSHFEVIDSKIELKGVYNNANTLQA